MTAGLRLAFEATLEDWAKGMDYCAISVPAKITEALGTKGAVLVSARVDDSQPFRVSLFPVGGGRHYMRIKAAVRRETKTGTGDRIRVRMTVLDRADVVIPEDLVIALHAGNATDAFRSLPPGEQDFLVRHIDDAVRPETRSKRIQASVAAAQRRKERKTAPV